MASFTHPCATWSFMPRREPPSGTRPINYTPAEVWIIFLHWLLNCLAASRASQLKTVSDVWYIDMDMGNAAAVFELPNHKDGIIDTDFGMGYRAVLPSVQEIGLGTEHYLDKIKSCLWRRQILVTPMPPLSRWFAHVVRIR